MTYQTRQIMRTVCFTFVGSRELGFELQKAWSTRLAEDLLVLDGIVHHPGYILEQTWVRASMYPSQLLPLSPGANRTAPTASVLLSESYGFPFSQKGLSLGRELSLAV